MWETPEQAFQELDKREFTYLAKPLWSYFLALQEQGFTKAEAIELVKVFSKFIYETTLDNIYDNDSDDDEDDLLDE